MTILSSRRLRSRTQRRILNWLLDYSGSLTEISTALTIRTPHTSLALSELRKRNSVNLEEEVDEEKVWHSQQEVTKRLSTTKQK